HCRALSSFPTRRSSDLLCRRVQALKKARPGSLAAFAFSVRLTPSSRREYDGAPPAGSGARCRPGLKLQEGWPWPAGRDLGRRFRSEEHTSELPSPEKLV